MAAPGSDEKHLEIKVGAVILVALAIMVTFVLVLGDWSFTSRKGLEVFFQNPGSLSAGAVVKVAGRKAGVIKEMTFLGADGPLHPVAKRPALVRCRIEVDEDLFNALREDARFYITTKGVLGDPFLEVDPGSSPTPLAAGKPVFGVDPPRLDLFLADAAELVANLNALLDRNAQNLDDLLGGSAKLMGAVNDMVDAGTGMDRFDRIMDHTEGLLVETRALVSGAKEKFVDDPQVGRILDNMESLSRKLDREIDPLIADLKEALEIVDRLGETVGPEEQAAIKNALARLEGITQKADDAIVGVNEMVGKIRKGEGTVGQLMADEEIYDDLKELVRDLKRHPWKLVWQE